MLKTKTELKNLIKEEKNINFFYCKSKKEIWFAKLTLAAPFLISRYLKRLRISEYYFYKKNENLLMYITYLYYARKRNKLGSKLGIEIHEGSLGQKTIIYHYGGGIVINPAAKIGNNCSFHGNNCIGNNGEDNLCPRIGNNVDIGYGAKIIGNINIGDNVIIGAGAVVVDSLPNNCVVIGVPAKIIRRF